MKANRRPTAPLGVILEEPRQLVARLILAELLAKRGTGPLERKVLIYPKRR